MSIAASTKEAAQKKKELSWFLSFQQKCTDCPRSNPVQLPPPAPDIFFEEDGLGIEITQYLLNQGKSGSHPCQLETTREFIVRTAQLLYELHCNEALQVTVLWANNLCPEKHEQTALATAISQAVSMRDKLTRIWRFEWNEFNEPLLLKYIHHITVIFIAHEGNSCWSNSICFSFGTLDYMVKSFQDLINGKQNRIKAYRKSCARIWLLIVADKTLFSSDISSHSALLEKTFQSEFERVFVLDERRDKLLDLRLINSP